MVVDSMTYEEIVAEFKYDWRNYFPSVLQRIMEDNKYRRYMLKEAKDNIPVYFKPIELTCKRGNKYILQINSKGRTDYKKSGLLYILYMYYRRSEGIYVVMLGSNGSWIARDDFYNLYTPHFFDRYRERELKDVHKPKLQTIIDFFQHNATRQYITVDNKNYPDSIFYTVPTGVMLGRIYNDYIYELRTYISFEMLKGKQIENGEILAARVKNYMDNRQ